jgi:hypothetical protein
LRTYFCSFFLVVGAVRRHRQRTDEHDDEHVPYVHHGFLIEMAGSPV